MLLRSKVKMEANNDDLHAPVAVEKKRRTGVGGYHCIAPGCTNYYYKDSSKSYHRLPLKKPALLKAWLQKLKRKDPPVNTNSRVCSNHFVEDDYQSQGMMMPDGTFGCMKTNRLKLNAVPSVFDFTQYSHGATDIPATAAAKASRRERREATRTKHEVTWVIYLCTS